MTINLLFFIITIKKVPSTLKAAIQDEQQRKLHDAQKAKMLQYHNRHLY